MAAAPTASWWKRRVGGGSPGDANQSDARLIRRTKAENWRTKADQPSNKVAVASRREWDSHAVFPETRIKTEQPHNRGPENSNGSGTSELRSGAIFADERGEAYNLLPLEEPVNLGLKCGGNCLTQRISGFPASVYDPAEIGLVNANHLGKPVLPYPCFVDRQLQIWVNRSLVEFHFLLASLSSAALNGGCGDPKSTSSQKNLPRVHWYPFSHHPAAQVIHDMF
jgi:hypothetical protein